MNVLEIIPRPDPKDAVLFQNAVVCTIYDLQPPEAQRQSAVAEIPLDVLEVPDDSGPLRTDLLWSVPDANLPPFPRGRSISMQQNGQTEQASCGCPYCDGFSSSAHNEKVSDGSQPPRRSDLSRAPNGRLLFAGPPGSQPAKQHLGSPAGSSGCTRYSPLDEEGILGLHW